jgi:hypothetical protein
LIQIMAHATRRHYSMRSGISVVRRKTFSHKDQAMRKGYVALVVGAMSAVAGLPLPASAVVCSWDWKYGSSNGMDYVLPIETNGPQVATFTVFGSITEIQINQGGTKIYRGPVPASWNVPGTTQIVVTGGTVGSVLRITTDWSVRPNTCR